MPWPRPGGPPLDLDGSGCAKVRGRMLFSVDWHSAGTGTACWEAFGRGIDGLILPFPTRQPRPTHSDPDGWLWHGQQPPSPENCPPTTVRGPTWGLHCQHRPHEGTVTRETPLPLLPGTSSPFRPIPGNVASQRKAGRPDDGLIPVRDRSAVGEIAGEACAAEEPWEELPASAQRAVPPSPWPTREVTFAAA